MVQIRKERKTASKVKLAHPDRSGPSQETLLQLAEERKLFDQADRHSGTQAAARYAEQDDQELDVSLPPTVARVMDALLWSVSLGMLHFTLDVLVQNQYAIQIIWPQIIIRAFQAVAVFFLLIFVLHPHPSSPGLLAALPTRFQDHLRQSIFFVTSLCSGCYLIHISNTFGYLAVMKQSPPLGCLWIWTVIELNLPLAVLSLACAGGFYYQGGYTVR
ncbi:hypothetical protein F4778DRAFT_180780 [Xylariomycetidae sp. FL2044]|nr:hypothetical protein F4778DRAFT_180780 [Xylariomycetidae sp. FL2044]